jgi:ribosomal protein L28
MTSCRLTGHTPVTGMEEEFDQHTKTMRVWLVTACRKCQAIIAKRRVR